MSDDTVCRICDGVECGEDADVAKRHAHIMRAVDASPPLTAEQRNKLAELLEPVRIAPNGTGQK
jgi:hypothetical protein